MKFKNMFPDSNLKSVKNARRLTVAFGWFGLVISVVIILSLLPLLNSDTIGAGSNILIMGFTALFGFVQIYFGRRLEGNNDRTRKALRFLVWFMAIAFIMDGVDFVSGDAVAAMHLAFAGAFLLMYRKAWVELTQFPAKGNGKIGSSATN